MNKNVEYYMNHRLKDDSVFRFNCQMCGECCIRKDKDAVVITGPDLVRIARELNQSVFHVVNKYCEMHIGPNSGVPVVALETDEKGQCLLMKNKRCAVHNNKPVVCAIYPLGRMISMDGGEHYEYFAQPGGGCPGERSKKEHSVKEWREHFHLDEREKESLEWHKLVSLAIELSKLSCQNDNVLSGLATILYDFDPDSDLVSQIIDRKKKLETILLEFQDVKTGGD